MHGSICAAAPLQYVIAGDEQMLLDCLVSVSQCKCAAGKLMARHLNVVSNTASIANGEWSLTVGTSSAQGLASAAVLSSAGVVMLTAFSDAAVRAAISSLCLHHTITHTAILLRNLLVRIRGRGIHMLNSMHGAAWAIDLGKRQYRLECTGGRFFAMQTPGNRHAYIYRYTQV